MIRYYLMVMVALPLLELFDTWQARHTWPVEFDGCFNNSRRFGWHCYAGKWEGRGWCVVKIFHLNVPFLRNWRRSRTLKNFQVAYVEGWHRLMLVHVVVRGVSPSNTWMREWIADDDCYSVPMEEMFR